MIVVEKVPRTKLWGDNEQGYIIVLECDCGLAVDYPGHPDDRTSVECEGCGKLWVLDVEEAAN